MQQRIELGEIRGDKRKRHFARRSIGVRVFGVRLPLHFSITHRWVDEAEPLPRCREDDAHSDWRDGKNASHDREERPIRSSSCPEQERGGDTDGAEERTETLSQSTRRGIAAWALQDERCSRDEVDDDEEPAEVRERARHRRVVAENVRSGIGTNLCDSRDDVSDSQRRSLQRCVRGWAAVAAHAARMH